MSWLSPNSLDFALKDAIAVMFLAGVLLNRDIAARLTSIIINITTSLAGHDPSDTSKYRRALQSWSVHY